MAVETPAGRTDSTISGLDALELGGHVAPESLARRAWSGTWPKLLAIALVLAVWQLLYSAQWRPSWVWPSVPETFSELGRLAKTANFWQAVATTMRRALIGFAMAIAIGFLLGVAVARIKVLRAAIGSLITALQTMPSIAWFPLAILVFQLSESAMYFVIVIGAAPSIANGVIAGVDYIPPLMLRAGHNIGARGINLYRHVIAPASLPAIVAGLKQGWAFSWRGLLAGELLVATGVPALGFLLEYAHVNNDAPALMATMIVILIIGIVVDAIFGALDRGIRARRGLAERVK
jgi:NitT/TauT family transport system permease protein